MHTVYNKQKKLFISVYKVVCSIVPYILLSFSCYTAHAQQYYWAKATGFPDTGAGSEAVTDLEAADGIIRYNGRQYAYESDFIFKRVETLVNKDGTIPGNFFWTGPEGKWIFRDEVYTSYGKMYALDGSTKQLTNICTASNLGSSGDLNESSIVFFKNRYYALGAVSDENSREIRVLRRFNSYTCQWDIIPLPSNPKIEGMDKMITDGTTLYIIATDNTLGDAILYGTEDVITWNTVVLPASLHITSWFYPKQELMSDKRGFILLKRSEDTQVTGDVITRFFSMKDQVFTPIAMGGDQPIYGYWGSFKSFDSGNLFSLSIDQKELLKSTDKGNSWTKIVTVNIPDEINDYIETRDGNIYIGTASGVYVLKKFKESTVTGCTDLTYEKKITNEVRCKKGAATFYIDGGVAPYTIHFQNKTYHTPDSLKMLELKMGYYEIDIEDAAGCSVNTDFYVNIDIRTEMEVHFFDKDICTGDFGVFMQNGYPPYAVTWKAGSEEKTQIFEGSSDLSSPIFETFNLDKEETYQFAVSDQSGCSVIQSLPQQGGFFKPIISFVGTDDCDSIVVDITIPKAIASDQFQLTIKGALYQVLNSYNWTGASYKVKVAHNAFYFFQVVSAQTQCGYSIMKNFSKPELVSLTHRDIYCNGQEEIKGYINLTLQNFNSAVQQIVWSDIGVDNTGFRTNLDAGVYSFEIPEETGCGVYRTVEIKKEIPDLIIPEIPFLCPGEIFHLVPETTDNGNLISFEVINKYNQSLFLNKGDGIDIVNDAPATYEIAAYNITTGCYSAQETVIVETPDSAPVLPKDTYTFCTIGDALVLRAASPNAYWYSTIDNKLLGTGASLLYTTTRPKDSVYVQLQNEDGTCTSLSAFVKLTLSDLVQPEIKVISSSGNKIVLKPVRAKSQIGSAIAYSWYGDAVFIGVADSLVVESGQWNFIQLEAKDGNGCIAEKSEKYYPEFTLGIKDLNAEKRLTVFPNPTRDMFVVQINKGFNTGLMKIKDMSGKSIWQSSITQNITEISVSEFVSGTYIVEVQLDDQELLHMLVVKY